MKPILFNTDMVRAILDGRKSVTRRAVKPQPIGDMHHVADGTTYGYWMDGNCQPYRPSYSTGNILYVRETWGDYSECQPGGAGYYLYRADFPVGAKYYDFDGHKCDLPRWRPSIHMPKEAARLFLRVTNVRVERLLTSFFKDGAAIMALKQEGMMIPDDCVECIGNYGSPSCVDAAEDSECGILDDVRGNFSNLWDSTIKKADRNLYGWVSNPWVWVIEFERVSREEAKGEKSQ